MFVFREDDNRGKIEALVVVDEGQSMAINHTTKNRNKSKLLLGVRLVMVDSRKKGKEREKT